MSPFILKEACPYCTKARSPRDIRQMPGGARICVDCQRKHEAAVLALSGLKANGNGEFITYAPPPVECSECHATPSQLKERGLNGDKWSVIFENGIYRYFCTPCADLYETKRKEFFKGTQYAQKRGLT